jgi:PAS domain S-box-containing protein
MITDIRKPSARMLLEVLAVTAAYYAVGNVGLTVPFTHGNISPVWPAAGIALGSILVFGRHACVGVAAGAFLVNLFSPVPLPAAAGLAAGNALGPLLAAALLKRRNFTTIKRLSDVFSLVVCAAAGQSVTAIIGPAVLARNGVPTWSGLASSSLIWWVGDCLGVLLATPLIVNAAEFRALKLRWMEFATLVATLLAGSAALLYEERISAEVFDFALLPFVIWGAVRFSIPGAALATSMLTGLSLWETARGTGPFVAVGPPLYNVGGLQVFVAVLSLSGLSLAALLQERTTVQEALTREEKLRQAQERYRTIVETTNDGVWLLDFANRTTFVNSRLTEMMGYTEAEMMGRSAFDFFFPEDIPSKMKHLQKQRSEKEAFYDRIRKKDGTELWVLVSANPVFDDSGRFLGILRMLSDVTMLRKTEESLIRNEKLISAGRLAATISHEVNNPLEAVINLMYLLKNETISPQGATYLKLAEKELQRVSAITRRTLGFFRETSAQSEFSVAELLDETIAFYEQQCAARAIRVIKDYRSAGKVRARRGEIQQVFANLTSNALDAMNGGGGALTVRVNDISTDRGPGVQVQFGDTGTGISSRDLERVFEPFFTTKQDTGTGLGLWVSKEIIHKHGGIISATSATGSKDSAGTQFIIFLPKSASNGAAA